jgi:hypothetical protein
MIYVKRLTISRINVILQHLEVGVVSYEPHYRETTATKLSLCMHRLQIDN